jgi:cytochrome c-type biogenesis protein CcmH/NrfG
MWMMVCAMACVVLVGCSDSTLDTAKIRVAMQSVGEGPKAQLESALTDIDAGKYKDALPLLRNFAYSAKLNSSQRKLIESTIAKVRAKAAQGS